MRALRAGIALLVVGTLLGSLACATGPTSRDRLLKRAAFDLNCTKDELSVTKLDDRTRGVRGCGQKATYVESCDAPPSSFGRKCTWVMNTHRGNGDDE
jgi:hypothetical protein